MSQHLQLYLTNLLKDKTLETTYRIKKYIEDHGRECVLATPERILPEGTDCVLVLGGDGTLIRAARDMHAYDVPLLGINMGTLGYLTEVELQNVEEALEQLFEGDSQVEKRMMLVGTINDEREELAFNDVVITRLGVLRVIHFKLYVNGELLNTYHADGMIVSTPTGSTAYNLSAGGPIVEPTASIIVVTPICSHALQNPCYCLGLNSNIMVQIDGDNSNLVICPDGRDTFCVGHGDKVYITGDEQRIQMVTFDYSEFFKTIRAKISKRGIFYEE